MKFVTLCQRDNGALACGSAPACKLHSDSAAGSAIRTYPVAGTVDISAIGLFPEQIRAGYVNRSSMAGSPLAVQGFGSQASYDD